VDENRKGWALRYLREAIDEIKIAKRNRRAADLIFDAIRKAQAAVYYSLGEPTFIDYIVNEMLEGKLLIGNPILRFLVEIEKSINRLENMEQTFEDELIMRESDRIVSIASKIVNLLTSED